jgi:hypothetical protein
MSKVIELEAAVADKDAKIISLSTRVEKMELERRTDQAKAEIDTLVRAGKAVPAERASLLKLALKDHDMFVELTKDRPKVLDLAGPVGSDADTPGDAADVLTLNTAVAAERTANPSLTQEQAYTLAISKHPELYAAAAGQPPTSRQ